jgi:uncharacterized integral membrane protein
MGDPQQLAGGFVMKVFYFLLLMLLIAAAVVFAVQNKDDVTIHYLQESVSAPLALVLGAGYVLGMLSGWTVIGLFKRSWREVTERGRVN